MYVLSALYKEGLKSISNFRAFFEISIINRLLLFHKGNLACFFFFTHSAIHLSTNYKLYDNAGVNENLIIFSHAVR